MPKQTIPTAESRQDNRGMWRIGRQDVEDFTAEACKRTADRIAGGELEDGGEASAQE